MSDAATLLALVAAAVGSAALTAVLRRTPLAQLLADQPNERSLHDAPRARIGGLGVVASSVVPCLLFGYRELVVPMACALALALVSLRDDRHSLPVFVRLGAHFAAAFAVVLACPGASTFWASAAAVAAIAWMTNLFNFMDGADGLAGGMGVIGFGALAAAAQWGQQGAIALSSAMIAAACLGFLVHNFPPARVFLGDAGSIPLGFLAGTLGAWGWWRGTWPAWFPAMAFAPFIADATATLVRRVARGEPFWRAHRSHLYQRLILGGWSHRRLALGAYAVMALSATCALLALATEGMLRSAIISAWTAALLLAAAALERRLARACREPLPDPDR
jgi:UDP-N-acetylmuramyl pentapeptide phosphotransferase/UDP-N-acetylglucosamine-1-phosphate transferase